MSYYKDTIKKLFEAIDPEGQLKNVQQEMEDTIEAAIADQTAEKDEQIKALESEIESIKSQQEAAHAEPIVQDEESAEEQEKVEGEPVQQLPQEKQEQVQQVIADLEQQAQQAFDKIEQQEQELEQLRAEAQQTQQKLQTLQQAMVQDMQDQVEAAKAEQKAEDEALAIQQTQELVKAMDDAAQQKQEELTEAISDFIDAFIDEHTQLNVAINATALAEAQTETFNKIRELLIDEKIFESGVKAKAEAMIAEAKESVNAQLNEAIAINKKNIALESEIATLKGAALLSEKVKFLKPSIAEAIMEELQGKSDVEIEAEFEKVQQQIEKNEEERKQLMRQQAKLRQQKIDKQLQSEEEPAALEQLNQSRINKNITLQGAFAKLIKAKK